MHELKFKNYFFLFVDVSLCDVHKQIDKALFSKFCNFSGKGLIGDVKERKIVRPRRDGCPSDKLRRFNAASCTPNNNSRAEAIS